MLRQHPVLGIGYGNFEEEIRHVAHNSFVHSYTELGFVGGTLFFGANAVAIWTLFCLRRSPEVAASSDSLRMLSSVTAIIVGAVVAEFSLSCAYTNIPYLAIGLATAFATTAPGTASAALPRFNIRFLSQIGVASAAFLLIIQIYVRFAVRWG